MKRFLALIFFLFSSTFVSAQRNDSISLPPAPSAPSLFSTKDTITKNDYLLSLEKVFQVLNKASVLSQPVPSILEVSGKMDDDDSAIALIKERLNGDRRLLNIRNLQMLSIILKQINKDSKGYSLELNNYDSIFNGVKNDILALRNDTLLRRILKEPALRDSFTEQLSQLRMKWKKTDSLLRNVHLLISTNQARASDNQITTNELRLQTQTLISTTGSRVFSKESPFLWQYKQAEQTPGVTANFKKNLQSERKITFYYFAHTDNQLLVLLVC
ncbi:MAG: hypothetical protein ACTHNG_14485, partial [Ginsengibacter sp.]